MYLYAHAQDIELITKVSLVDHIPKEVALARSIRVQPVTILRGYLLPKPILASRHTLIQPHAHATPLLLHNPFVTKGVVQIPRGDSYHISPDGLGFGVLVVEFVGRNIGYDGRRHAFPFNLFGSHVLEPTFKEP